MAPKTKPTKGKSASPAVFTQSKAPISKSVNFKPRTPRLETRGSTIVVRHTEYVADISAPNAAFNVVPYSINPGLNTLFPWLSSIASNYESYKFRSLRFKYKPICPTTTPGKVMLGVDYDASDNAPTTKMQLNSYESTQSASVWDSVTQTSTTANLLKFGTQRYIRVTTNPAGTDVKTYDIGRLYVASSNTPATNTVLGELYAEYEVELLTPQLISANGSSGSTRNTPLLQYANIYCSPTGGITLTSEFYTTPIFVIANQRPLESSSMVDFIINPAIKDALMVNIAAPAGSIFGRYTNNVGGSMSAFYNVGNFSNNIYSALAGYNRSFMATFQTPFETPDGLPGFRMNVPFTTNTKINMFGLVGSPNIPLNDIDQSLLNPMYPGPKVDYTNWAQLTNFAALGIAGFIQDKTGFTYRDLSTIPEEAD